MMRARVVGRLDDAAKTWLREWARGLGLQPVTKSSYVDGRLEGWFRRGSNLQSIACGRAELFDAPEPPERLAAFGDRWLAGWRSLLVCGGPTSIRPHRDHGHFEARAIMINLGAADFSEYTDGPRAEPRVLQLVSGDVVELDVKLTHASRQRSTERWTFTFRTIRPCFEQATEKVPSLFEGIS